MDEHREADPDATAVTATDAAAGPGHADDVAAAGGAGSRRADAAETWAVAAFNLVAFALPLVVLGHASGALADTLPDVGTVTGLLGFGYLWLLVWLSTRWVFAEGGLSRSAAGETGRLLLRGTLGGALVGMGFVAGAAGAVAVGNLLSGLGNVTSFALLLLFGAAGGAVGGLPVGLLLGLLDVALYRASGALDPEPPG